MSEINVRVGQQNAVRVLSSSSGAQGIQGTSGVSNITVGDANQVLYKNASNVAVGSTNLIFDGQDLTVSGDVNATQFNQASDRSLKEDILKIENSLDKIEQLNGVSFKWKSNKRSSIGVIAQDVEKVFPELVHGKQIKTVNYDGLIAVLIESIKDLKEEINQLKSQLNHK
jgi:hypothetical protein